MYKSSLEPALFDPNYLPLNRKELSEAIAEIESVWTPFERIASYDVDLRYRMDEPFLIDQAIDRYEIERGALNTEVRNRLIRSVESALSLDDAYFNLAPEQMYSHVKSLFEALDAAIAEHKNPLPLLELIRKFGEPLGKAVHHIHSHLAFLNEIQAWGHSHFGRHSLIQSRSVSVCNQHFEIALKWDDHLTTSSSLEHALENDPGSFSRALRKFKLVQGKIAAAHSALDFLNSFQMDCETYRQEALALIEETVRAEASHQIKAPA